MSQNLKDMSPEQKKKMRRVLCLCGIFFFAIGAFVVSAPSVIAGFIKIDDEIAQIIGGVFAIMGLMDFVIAKVLFSEKDKVL